MRIFVSYTRTDQAAVEVVVAALRRAGHDIWVDALLRSGQMWWPKILDEIERADAVVLAVSPHYLRSQACVAERRYADQVLRPVLPIEIEPVLKATLPADLGERHLCTSASELVDALAGLDPSPPLPRRMPKRPASPAYPPALLRDLLTEGPLDEPVQIAAAAELVLTSRARDPAEAETGRVLVADAARSNYLLPRPRKLLDDELSTNATAPPTVPPTAPTGVIVGAGLAGISLFSVLSLLRVYAVLPRPYEVVGPHAVLLLVATALCAAAWRTHRRSAVVGLTVCGVGLLALVADLARNSGLL